MNVLIYANGSSKTGGSHTKRMESLHQRLTDRNFNSLFFTNLNEFKKHITINKKNCLVIIDVPESFDENLSFLFKNNIKIIGYEYSGDLLFDYNIVPFKFKLRNFKAKTRVFFGLKFLIIRDDIVLAKVAFASGYPEGLITLGAGKSKHKATKLRNVIVRNENTNQVKIILGKFSRELSFPKKYILKNPLNFASLLSNAEIIFTSGGATLAESIYMEKRIVCWPQNDSEKEFARHLAQLYNFRIISTYREVPRFDDIERTTLKISKPKELIGENGLDEIIELISGIINETK